MKKPANTKFHPGQRIRFWRLDGTIVDDVVRECFIQHDHEILIVSDQSECPAENVIAAS